MEKHAEHDRSIILRKAAPEDAESIAKLKVICWRHTYQGLMPQGSLDGLDAMAEVPHWRSWLEDTSSGLIAWLLFAGDELTGYGLAGSMRMKDRPGTEIPADSEIYALYIHPDHQRFGYGRKLFAALVRELLSGGYDALGLWMVRGNEKAEKFYLGLGGEEAGKRVEITNGRIIFREKGWYWESLKHLETRFTAQSHKAKKHFGS